ncbi:MAG: penicillin-binding transpeptidase domain-containing protein, partial [Planctomycetota bacterium]
MTRKRPATTCPRTVPVGQLRRNLEAVQRFRLSFVFGALLVLFAGLLGRLAKLQLVDAATYRTQALGRQERVIEISGPRGRILDVHGRTLVTSRWVLSVAVDPSELEDPIAFSRGLAILLDAPEKEARIRAAILDAGPTCRYRMLFPLIEDQRVVEQLAPLRGPVAAIRAGFRGLIVTEREKRTYPNGDYAAHVLGHPPHEGECGREGARGAECLLHDEISPCSHEVPVRRDGGRRYMACEGAGALNPSGSDASLTLDIVIQHFLETALDDLCRDWSDPLATGIVMDPGSGHVLALANRPGYDPRSEPETLNLAVQGLFAPGSLFKPFTVAQALKIGVVQPGERIPLPPVRDFVVGRMTRRIHDSHDAGDYDGLGDVVRIIAESSNTGVAELALRLTPEGMRCLIRDAGFDLPTGIGLGPEPEPAFSRPLPQWNACFPTLGIAYGQGLNVSPLRLLSSFAAF